MPVPEWIRKEVKFYAISKTKGKDGNAGKGRRCLVLVWGVKERGRIQESLEHFDIRDCAVKGLSHQKGFATEHEALEYLVEVGMKMYHITKDEIMGSLE